MIYIIGHTKPDLDSAVAALALERLYQNVDCFGYKEAKAVLAGEANYETKYVFKKFKIALPPVLKTEEIKKDDQFILVDHNEQSQRLEGIKNKQIINIIDHHKVSLNLNTPIYITSKAWGASATIVAWLMKISDYQADKNLASLMLSAILSDTVALKSPTTNQKDKDTLEKLKQIAQIDNIDKLTFTIFKAKSSLVGLNVRDILTKDYKLFDFGLKKVLINQVETVEQDKVIANSKEYINDLMVLKDEMKLDRAYCVVTDILNVNSKCLSTPEDEGLLNKSFPQAKIVKDGVFDLGAIMSRKKEIAPAIEKAIIEN